MTLLRLVAALAAGASVSLAVGVLARPKRALRSRVGPYLAVSGGGSEVVGRIAGQSFSSDLRVQWFGPIAQRIVRSGLLGSDESLKKLEMKIRRAGKGLSAEDFLALTLGYGAIVGVGGVLAGIFLTKNVLTSVGLGLLSGAVGLAKQRGSLNSDIEKRAAKMRLELYSVNQLLAIHLRTGGSVGQAIQQVSARGSGEIVSELREVLSWMASGVGLVEAFNRASQVTPEPYVARTYKLLAVASERGADLADALNKMSSDLREARVQELRRAATRKRGAMLLPTLLLLAPVMMLFIGAPLVSIMKGAF